MNPLTQSKNATIPPVLFALTLACFALSPMARAVCQEGCNFNKNNTFLGDDALISNTIGSNNTAIGSAALEFNTNGSDNTAIGYLALSSNTVSTANTATGAGALALNTTGCCNTANGSGALGNNTTGVDNTATGLNALLNNTTGINNTANGIDALQNNTIGYDNTATGSEALSLNKTGHDNTAEGYHALERNHTGSSNVALGSHAGFNLTGSNNIDIGNVGVTGESDTIRIGTTGTQANAYIAGISGATVPTGVAVIVDSSGHLGTTTSSARFKDEIKPMEKASEAILALKPVSFRYKRDLDPQGTPQFGLVAEDVEKVNRDLVARDEQGKPYSVRYDAVNAMLLNEFLKEHREVQQQEATITELKSAAAKQEANAARQQKQIEALTARLQQVSAQLELSKPVSQTIVSNERK